MAVQVFRQYNNSKGKQYMSTNIAGVSATARMPGAWTWTLITLVCAGYLTQLLHAGSASGPDIDALSKAANIGYLTLTSEPWRLLTSMFMHGDWLHLLLNLSVLAYVGPMAEAVLKGRTYLIVFLAGGMLAGLGSAIGGVAMAERVNLLGQVRYDLIVSVGSSGALMAVCGALLAAYMLEEGEHRHPLLQQKGFLSSLLPTVGLTLAFGFIRPSTDQVAHVVGVVAGMIMGAVVLQAAQSQARAVRVLGPAFCALLAPLLTAILMPLPAAVELKSIAEDIAANEQLEAQYDRDRQTESEEDAQPVLLDSPQAHGIGEMWGNKVEGP